MEPKFLLIVKVPRGIVIRDTPRPQSEGGANMRAVPVGSTLMCYDIINVAGVEYARLVPQNPQKPEWVRVAESDHSIVYVDVIPLETPVDTNHLAEAIHCLADAINKLAKK